MRRIAILTLLLATASSRLCAADDDRPVQIVRKPATTHTRTFDPKNPPSDMMKLGPREAAYTRSTFLCSAGAAYLIVSSEKTGGRQTVTIKIQQVTVELSLDNTFFLPQGASKKLIAHEQGHAAIAEAAYLHADDVARKLAAPLIGQTVTATGADEEAAGKAAFHKLIDKLNDDYMNTVPARSSTVNDIYDTLTQHGTNSLDEAEAIRRSFARADRQSTTRAAASAK